MEPTIYKPSIYKGAGIYKAGAEGGGGGGALNGVLTRADLSSGFSFNNLENAVRGIQQGICDSTYALNNSIMQGFHGVDNVLVLVQDHVDDVVDAADGTGFLNILPDGVALQLACTGRFRHHHPVVDLNGIGGRGTGHNRFGSAGVAGKVVKFNVAQTDSNICLTWMPSAWNVCS